MCHFTCQSCRATINQRETVTHECVPHVDETISDAEVLVALNAYEWVYWRDEPESELSAFLGDRVPAMRAALTAAREARS